MVVKSPAEFNNKLSFIFHAMLALPLAAFVYLFLEVRHRELQPAMEGGEENQLVIALIAFLALVVVALGYQRFRNDLAAVNTAPSFQQKLSEYLRVSLKFYAFVEASSILWVLGLYLTTSAIFIIGYVILLFFMSLQRPTLQKYVGDMNLSKDQRDAILHKQPFKDSDLTSQGGS